MRPPQASGATSYGSSVTCSIQVTWDPSSASCMARWTVPVRGEAPCQCFSPEGIQTVSPGLISRMGPPQVWTRPTPGGHAGLVPTGGYARQCERLAQS
jgi:hypothetical protein